MKGISVVFFIHLKGISVW